VALLLATALGACADDEAPGAGAAPGSAAGLDAVVVRVAQVPREVAFDGVIEAVNQATVAAQTGGRVVELPFDVGDYVQKGAVIARFTAREQRARTDAGNAAVAEARARLAEAQVEFDRIQGIYERRLVAKARFDQASADLESARARADAAEAARVEAREGLGYTAIRAPYSGIVLARHVRIGETVAVGKPIMTGLSLEHLRVIVDIPERQVLPLRKHRRARVILPDGESVPVEELRIPPGADPQTHAFRVLATLPAGEHPAFPGTLVKVAFVSGADSRLLVPANALVRRNELTAVYVIGAAEEISLRYTKAGSPVTDGRIPILAGLADGERVATDPIAAAIVYKHQPARRP
jgi:RND family efflux transporter MFP subunit